MRRAFVPAGMLLALAIAAGEPLRAAEPYGRFQYSETEREHWAFLPVIRPEVPAVARAGWVENPIDAFVLAALEAKGIEPAPDADPGTLHRRLALDATGLLPTPDEQEAVAAQGATEAYRLLVEDMLARPAYGERWARHWLDVVRYAESNGYERDGAKPHAWRYRDWVVDAFNADKPYDRFLIEQIAGDELPDSDAQTQIATTFLRLGPWDDEPADPKVDRYDQLDDVLAATATAFMGLTLRCARCHDHKFEPFSQRDYARMLAVFEPLTRPQEGRTDLDRMVGTSQELAAFHETTTRCDAQAAEVTRQIDEMKGSWCRQLVAEGKSSLPGEVQAAMQAPPDARDERQKQLLKEHASKIEEELLALAGDEGRARLAALADELARIASARPAELPRAYIWFEKGPAAEVTHVFRRGDPYQPLEPIDPGLPAVLVDAPPPPASPTPTSTGRRLQLARWLADPAHPLTARVMVNRIWQHHFGQGLVTTANDFGLMGEPPTHPELLDWLAAEFVAVGFSVKALDRLILTSHTYRLAAADTPSGVDRDPLVERLWRWRPRRLEAEAIRDNVLAVSGRLNLKRGGPSVFPPISAEVLAGQSQPGSGWKTSPPEEACRRSLYVFAKRTLPLPELEVLDLPASELPCQQRTVSTIAPQALTFLNGAFMQEAAGHFARRLEREAPGDPAAQIERAFRLALGRGPSNQERQLVEKFLADHAAQIAADAALAAASNAPAVGAADQAEDMQSSAAQPSTAQPAPAEDAQAGAAAAEPGQQAAAQALAAFCLVLLNGNEFFYLD